MADSYRPEGEGPHPTLAGNMFDPGVKADGKISSGQGVGGTSESTVCQEGAEHLNTAGSGSGSGTSPSEPSENKMHDEGIDHIKSNIDAPGSSEGTSSVPPITAPQPPASNSGAEDATAGIAKGSGGLSSSANAQSAVPSEPAQQGSMFGTVKSYLGFGGKSGEQPAEARNAGEDTSASGDVGDAGLGSEGAGDSGVGEAGVIAGGAASAKGATDASDPTADASTAATTADDPMRESAAGTAAPKDSDVTTGAPPTESADPTSEDRAMTDKEQKAEGTTEGGLAEHEKKLSDRETGSGRENKDAIPTAGGEKLGVKHWGESKVVPDNPKPEPEKAGVSGEDGQPTDQVRDNTKANTGSAAPPGHSSSSQENEKESLVDKIKDKLNISKP